MEEKSGDMLSEQCPPPLGEGPWIVYTHEVSDSNPKRCQTFTSLSASPHDSKSYIRSIPEMSGRHIEASFGNSGWLLLRDVNDDEQGYFSLRFHLYDAATSRCIRLPELTDMPPDEQHRDEAIYTLRSTPDSDDCVLFLYGFEQVFYCRPARSDVTWVRQTIDIDGKKAYLYQTAVLNNVLYALAVLHGDQPHNCGKSHCVQEDDVEAQRDEWTIVSIEVDDVSNSLIFKNLHLDWPDYSICSCTQHLNLLESCGSIYCVAGLIHSPYQNRYSVIKVWELDLKGSKWVEVNSLNGRAFFIGVDMNSTWCRGESDGVPGDCVYYFWGYTKYDDPKTVYSYSLQDNTTTPLLVCPTLINNPCKSFALFMPHHEKLVEERRNNPVVEIAKAGNQEIGALVDDIEAIQLQQNETQQSLFDDLPMEKLDLFDDSSLQPTRKLFRQKGCDRNSPPVFLYFKDDGLGSCRVIDPFRATSRSIVLPPYQDHCSIDFIQDDWLLIQVQNHPTHSSLQYFNPFTRVRGNYPYHEEISYVTCFGFSTYPTSQDCLMVGICDVYTFLYVLYHRFGEKEWKKSRYYHHPHTPFRVTVSSPVYCNGAFYFFSTEGHLVVFELSNDGEERWQLYDKPMINQSKDYEKNKSCHLVECNGELYSVFFGNYGKCVNVFRFDISNKHWMPIKSLGDYCFFISHRSSISIRATEAGMRNRIYLPRFKGNGMVFYCLEARKYGVCGNDEDSFEDLFYTTEPLSNCWI